jgi:predicted DNA-binding transcriptional regulator AlpA
VTNYLRFEDLKERGIVKHWLTLRRWIKHAGFPPGILLGPNTRAFPEADVEAWLASRPTKRGDDA